MRKRLERFISILCAFAIIFMLNAPVIANAEDVTEEITEELHTEQDAAKPAVTDAEISEMKDDLTGIVNNSLTKESCVYGNEWAVMTAARAGVLTEEMKTNYYDSLVSALQQTPELDGMATTYARVIICLSSIDKNPADVNGVNLLKMLSDIELAGAGDVNAVMYALIAFDCKNYEIPKADEGKTQMTRDALVADILSHEISGGGWDWADTAPDPDMTSIAIQALTPYCDTNSEAKAAVDRGITVLSNMQNDDGSFSSYGWANACSTAQVITALTGMGINPLTDSRFIKNEHTIFDGLNLFYQKGQGVIGYGDELDLAFSTVQSSYALVSYDRMLNGKTSLYNMNENTANDKTNSDKAGLAKIIIIVVIVVVLLIVCCVIVVMKMRKSRV